MFLRKQTALCPSSASEIQGSSCRCNCYLLRPCKINPRSQVWAALPEYLSDVVEGVQRKALRIVFPGLSYSEALVASGLQTLATRRGQACVNFLHDARAQEPLRSVLTSTASQTNYHGYTLRSGKTNLIRQPCEFVTHKYS